MRFGIPLSAAGHAALVALAVWGLPWLKSRPRPPVPAVEVSLVSPAELAALSRGRPAPVVPEPAPAPTPPPVAEVPWPEPEPEPEVPEEEELPDLALGFDAAAPLGFEGLRPVQPADGLGVAAPPRPRREAVPGPRPAAPESAGDVGAEVATTGGAAELASYQAAVREAIAKARIYPRAALDRGVTGIARIEVSIARDGRLVEARIVKPSGSVLLDRAALDAARRARLPAAPPTLIGAGFAFQIALSFELNG